MTGETGEVAALSIWSKPLTQRVPGISLRILILSVATILFNAYFATYSAWVLGIGFSIPWFFFLLVEYMITRLVSERLQFTVEEWVVWSITTIASTFTTSGFIYLLIPPVFTQLKYPQYANLLPSLWGPTNPDMIRNFLYGGPIDWGVWLPIITYWILMMVCFYLMGFFLLLPFRKPWIEVERLAVPNIVVSYEFLKWAKAQDRPSLWDIRVSKWFWIGIVLGVLHFIPDFTSFFFAVPEYYFFGWRRIDLSPYLGKVLHGAYLSEFFHVTDILPLAAFVPMDILGTAILSTLVFAILLPVLFVSQGLEAPYEWAPSLYGIRGGVIRWKLMFGDYIAFGGIVFGVVAWVLFQNWRRIRDTLKAAFKGTPTDENEPFSWRFTWICYFIFTIGFAGLLIYSGSSIIAAILVILLLQLTVIYWARWLGDLGCWLPGGVLPASAFYVKDAGLAMGLWPPGELNQDSFVTFSAVSNFEYLPGQQFSTLPSYSVYGFKMGEMTRVQPRSIGISYILMLILAVVIAVPFAMYILHDFGFYASSAHYWPLEYMSWYPNFQTNLVGTSSFSSYAGTNPYPWVIGGAVVTFACFYLRTIFPWFFIHPLGLSFSTWFWLMPAWVEMFVIKWLVLRIGGAKAYERLFVPAVVGFAVGMGIAGFTITLMSLASLPR